MKQLLTVLLFLSVFMLTALAGTNAPPQSISPLFPEQSWGPDTYGYIARDSNEPGGPVFDYIDISAIGTPVSGLGDDNIVGPFNIGFPFRFYWYDVTSFYIGSNGYLRFSGSGQLSHPFTNIPNPMPPNDLICMYAADFDPSAGGTVYYWTNYTDTLIVSFDDVPAWNVGGPTGSHYFQVILSMVDTSITVNYGPQNGAFYDNAGVVGIENVAGDIGIECYNTNAVPAYYSIKYYYPQTTTYQVHDVAVTRVQNAQSTGFFLQPQQSFVPNATIKNTGNQNEANFHAIAELRSYPGGIIVMSDSLTISTLNAGEEIEVTFTEAFSVANPGDYYLQVRTDLTGDMVASNDTKSVEAHCVSLPGELYFDDGSSEQLWTWSGGYGGAGVYYTPPTYPVLITELKAYLGSGTLPVLLELYDDDGPDGLPGTQLGSIQVNAATEGWYTVDFTSQNLVINDGGVYAVWMMTGDGASGVGIDQNSIGSRNTVEYTGVWATFREAETSDAMIRLSVEPIAQEVFFDDFESGPGNWTGDWALTNQTSHSPVNSYTDSPGGNYPNNAVLIGQMASGVDLSGFFGAYLEFYTKYELETGFDYCYLEVSTDGGATWIPMKTYNGEGIVTQFTKETVDLGAFAGQPDVRVRFRLVTDAGYNTDGMYLDDLRIVGLTVDNSPPLIMFNLPQHYAGVPDTFWVKTKITDISGIAQTQLSYWVDDDPASFQQIQPATVSGDSFHFAIPPQTAGAMVRFYIEAWDSSAANHAITDTVSYIAGEHLIYDDGDPEYIIELAGGSKIATKFMPGFSPAVLKTALLRIYTDISHPIDSVTVHIWNDNGGVPGADLVTPFKKYPDCTLADPEAWTVVDLRPLQLVVNGPFWVGYDVPPAGIAQLYDSPAVWNNSMIFDGTNWNLHIGDFHIRSVIGDMSTGTDIPPVNLMPKDFVLKPNYPNPFNPTTTIPFGLPEPSRVQLEIFNLLGQKVATLYTGQMDAGYHKLQWQPKNLGSGIYIYRLQAKGMLSNREAFRSGKMMLLK